MEEWTWPCRLTRHGWKMGRVHRIGNSAYHTHKHALSGQYWQKQAISKHNIGTPPSLSAVE
jgi:hypothetical protein